MIKLYKEYEGKWTVYNKVTGKAATIIQYVDRMLGEVTTYYRVDVDGRTRKTMIRHFQTARKEARLLLQS